MNLVAKRHWFYLLSAIIIVPGIISLLIPPSLYLGIEFTGGSTISVEFEAPVTHAQVREVMNKLGHSEAEIQTAGANSYFIRTTTLREANVQTGASSEQDVIKQAFGGLATVSHMEVASVSGVVAKDTVRNAFIAVVIASIAILLYITYAFRHVPNPVRFGTTAVIALIHDVLVVTGIFSILGKMPVHMEINAMFITGLLTVIGYSVHDTIVVFDRIRENSARLPGERLERVINISILETLGRSLNTSLTVVFTTLALLLLGGESIRGFLLVLLIGIVTGTYSSICVASQLLMSWESGEIGSLLRRFHLLPARSQA